MHEPPSGQPSGPAAPADMPSGSATLNHEQRVKSRADGSGTVDYVTGVEAEPARPPAKTLVSIPGYETLGILGRGGMGVVYLARQVRLGRLVALKMILRGAEAGPEEVERFRLEAQAVARLQHPNIVQIHEVGDHDGMPYFSLELIDGGNLDQKLGGTPLPAAEAAPLVETLARAMHAAHQQGIIHRDLKPINVLLTKDGVPKIADFGLAKHVEANSGQTHTGQVLGTPSYMAPEQAMGDGKAVGAAADTYALGAILYETLTGRPPFMAASLLDTLDQVRTQEPVAPRQLQPRVPRDLETICLKCLQKEPSKRYGSAAELADDLRRFQRAEPIHARPVGPAERLARWCRRNPVVAGLVAALFTVLVTGLTLVSWKWQEALDHAANESAAKVHALRAEGDARAAEATVRAERRKTQRQLALSRLEQGLSLCQRGEVSQGLFVMVSALPEAIQAEDTDLEWSIRMQLAAWAQSLRPLRGIVASPAYGNGVWVGPDGRTILAVGKDGKVRLDTVAGQAFRAPQKTPVDLIELAAISPNGRVAYIQGTVSKPQLWDVASGRFTGSPLEHSGKFGPIAFSPDGKFVATCPLDQPKQPGAEHVQTWSVPRGEPTGPPLVHPDAVLTLEFSPDSKTLVTGCKDGKARLWQIPSGKLVGNPCPHGGEIRSVAFYGDRIVVTAGEGRILRLWDVATSKPVGFLEAHEGADLIYAVAASTRGRFVTGGNSSEARLWWSAPNKASGGWTVFNRSMLHATGAAIHSVAFSRDMETVITGATYHSSRRGDARLWDAVTALPVGQALPHRGQVHRVAFSKSGDLIIVEGQDESRLWQTLPLKSRVAPLRHEATVFRGSFSPDGRMFLTTSGDTTRLWRTDTAQPIASLVQGELIQFATFSPDGKSIATADFAKTVCIWNAATGKRRGDPLKHPENVMAISFSPDSTVLVTACDDQRIRLFDTTTGKSLGDPVDSRMQPWTAAFSPDGKTLLVGGLDEPSRKGEARLLDVATRQFRDKSLTHPALVNQVAFSADGKRLLTICQGSATDVYQARWWDTDTAQPLGAPMVHQGKIAQVAFSPDGRTVATASQDMTVRLWHAFTGQPFGTALQHPEPATGVAFSPDGRTVLTACADGAIRQWEIGSGRLLGPPLVHRRGYVFFALHPDGKLLLTGGADQAARLWRMADPLAGDGERITCWLQVLMGTELDDHGAVQLLDPAVWNQLLQRLEMLGGAP